MSASLPIIASNFPLWQVLIREGSFGICVDPGNPRAIAEVILMMVTHPEVASVMGHNGQMAVSERFNWAAESKKLCNFYGRVINRP
jgi:glycosyltransferase involved in cell wall biosynthesis